MSGEGPPDGYYETCTVLRRALPEDWDETPGTLDNPRFVANLRSGHFGVVIESTVRVNRVTLYRDRVDMGGSKPPDVDSAYVDLLQAERQARLQEMYEASARQHGERC